APLGIEVQSPDQFLMNQLDLAPQDVMIALQHMAQATQNPPMTIREILSSLERCGLSAFSVAAAQQLWRISP
ncbi:hypothetical protein QP580_12845, partial [Prevotella bivia]|nr:hypothetical protein [Prevotella bivia]